MMSVQLLAAKRMQSAQRLHGGQAQQVGEHLIVLWCATRRPHAWRFSIARKLGKPEIRSLVVECVMHGNYMVSLSIMNGGDLEDG
jgi:hypothetical protein